jgi:integrase
MSEANSLAVSSFSAGADMSPSSTDDLFEEPMLGAIERQFDAWLAMAHPSAGKRALSKASKSVYRDMWSRFARFCVEHLDPPRWPAELTVEHLKLHLSSRQAEGLTDRYVWRLLTLIDNVLTAHAEANTAWSDAMDKPRPTVAAEVLQGNDNYRHANAGKRDELPEHLRPGQAQQLIDHLQKVLPDASGRRPKHTWQEVRNCASVATQLGAGLGPGDVRAMLVTGAAFEKVDGEDIIWRLVVPSNNGTPQRETPIARWAADVLAYWLVVRAEQQLPGNALFPATRAGAPLGKVGQYEASVNVLAAAGLGQAAGGSFRLRHTFALRQLHAGKTELQVAQWLGVGLDVVARYRGVLRVDPHAV